MIKTISRTQDTILVVDDTGLKTARTDHPKWTDIDKTFNQIGYEDGPGFTGPVAELLALMDMKTAVETYTVGRLSVSPSGVTYGGRLIHTIDAERVLAFMKEGLSYKPIANYIEKKMKNPSARAIQEMYNFLEHKGMPLTVRGTFLAYKGVTLDFWSINGNKDTVVLQGEVNFDGKIRNAIGSIIEVERSSVDDNFHNGCSFGLHAGSLSYARGWGKRVVIVEIDPADVVSVPADCSCQKLRCCKYTVIGEYSGPLPDTLCTDFEEEDDVCHQCGAPDGECACDDTWCSNCNNEIGNCTCHSDDQQCACGQSSCPDCGPDVAEQKSETPDESWIREKATIEDQSIPTAGGAVPLPFIGSEPPKAEPIPNANITVKMPVKQLWTELKSPGVSVQLEDVCGCNTCVCGADETTQSSDTFKKVREVLVDVLGVDWKDVEPSTRLDSGFLGIDSLDGVELVMMLEEEFGIEISDEDAEKAISATVSDIVKYIETRVANQYNLGIDEGKRDRASGRFAKYVAGDEKGADSPAHDDFIRGYVIGYGMVS